jgi:alkylated DNA repair dioxygenase AlkB
MQSDIRQWFPSLSPKKKSPKAEQKEAVLQPSKMIIQLDEECWMVQDTLPSNLLTDFEEMWAAKSPERGSVMMYGASVETPRWQQSYGQDYWFTGSLHRALPLPQIFEPIWRWAQTTEFGPFTQTLVNHYKDGTDYIGPHADSMRQVVPRSPILSVSLRAERTFRIRDKTSKRILHDITMPDKTFVAIGGLMQERYLHEVPKISGKKARTIGRRINITFRRFE